MIHTELLNLSRKYRSMLDDVDQIPERPDFAGFRESYQMGLKFMAEALEDKALNFDDPNPEAMTLRTVSDLLMVCSLPYDSSESRDEA